MIYSNGGSCIAPFDMQSTGHWIVNNTCYKNGLDLEGHGAGTGNMQMGNLGEMAPNLAPGNFFVNNIMQSWPGVSTVGSQHPIKNDSGANTYNHNLRFGLSNDILGGSTVINLIGNQNPQFKNPLYVSDTIPTVPGTGWFRTAENPLNISDQFILLPSSPAINAGVDPTSLTTDSTVQLQLRLYVGVDMNGITRPQSTGWDLGAYEYVSTSPTPTLTQIPTSTPSPSRNPNIVPFITLRPTFFIGGPSPIIDH